jgi:hypothetical protein
MIAGERILHDLQGWLSPPNPSTNHNIACGAQHERTAVWVFSEDIYKEWESSGSLLWIHGKGLSLYRQICILLMIIFAAGSGKSILWLVLQLSLRMQKFIPSISSAIIQHLITLRDAGLASAAYFYFDFKDVDKKHQRNLLSSLLIQFSYQARPCLDILCRLYSAHKGGKEQPSERALVQCLKDLWCHRYLNSQLTSS